MSPSIQAAGANFLTVHGRTKDQRGEPVNLEAIKIIKESVNIPVIANGDIKTLKDVDDTVAATGEIDANTQEATDRVEGVDGVMAARGMLENPAMFAGFDTTPDQCVADWVRIALNIGTPFNCFHHHLIYMCERRTSRFFKIVKMFHSYKTFFVLGQTEGFSIHSVLRLLFLIISRMFGRLSYDSDIFSE